MAAKVCEVVVYPVEPLPPETAYPYMHLGQYRWELWATDGTFLTAATSHQKALSEVHKAARTAAEALGYVVAA